MIFIVVLINLVMYMLHWCSRYLCTTNRLFRDASAWYHIVVAVDTTQGTASNRVKFYINGVQETSFAQTTYPSLNAEYIFNIVKAQYRYES
jgi:hypothetical protein